MGVINVQQRNADEQQRSVAARSKKTQEEEVQCKKLADAAMRDLASAMPALEEAIKVRVGLESFTVGGVNIYILQMRLWVCVYYTQTQLLLNHVRSTNNQYG